MQLADQQESLTNNADSWSQKLNAAPAESSWRTLYACNMESYQGPSGAPSQMTPQKTHELPLNVPVVRCDERFQTAYSGACSRQMPGCISSLYACRMIGSHALWVGEVLLGLTRSYLPPVTYPPRALPLLALLCTGRGGDLG